MPIRPDATLRRDHLTHRSARSRAWPKVALGAGLLVVVVLGGIALRGDDQPTRIDREATERLVHVSPTRGIERNDSYQDVAALGAAGPVLVFTGLLLTWAVSRRDPPAAVIAVVGPFLAVVSVERIAKPLVDRRLGGEFSYPAGTSTAAAAVATVGALLVWRYARKRLAVLATVVAGAVAVAVAVALVGLSWHYLTDAFAGVAYGAGVVLVVAGLVDLLWPADAGEAL